MIRKIGILLTMSLLLALGFSVVQAQDDDDDDLVIDSAWQPFEDGVMLWFAGTDEIWVLVDNDIEYDSGDSDGTDDDGEGTILVFADPHSEGEDDDKGDSGCEIDPVRGFGEVYFNNNLEAQLGCPLDGEIGYDGTSNPGSDGAVTIDGPGDTVYEVNRDNNRWTTQQFF